MSDRNLLNAKDTISGKMGRAIATIDGNIEEMFYVKKIEVKMKKNKKELPILGKMATEHKATGVSYTGTATLYYITSFYRKMLLKYSKEGIDTYFDILIENEDPTSGAGKQAVMIKGVNLDEGIIAKFDIESDSQLDEEITFTFNDWELLDEFQPLI